MSEPNAEQQPQEGDAATETKTFDADYVDKLRKEAAKYRNEAKANADAAKRLAEIEEAQKSETEKSADRIKALETEIGAARREALRFKVASKFGIGDEDADLFLTGSDEETLTKQAERLAGRSDQQKKQGNFVPLEGGTKPPAGGGGERETIRALFGS